MYAMILYVYEIACCCGKNVSSPFSFRELCDSAIREMNEYKFLYETESDSDVSIMHYNENADLSDGEDDELLPLDTEVGTDDDQENQADAVASAATTTTAASVEEEDRPEFRPHRKLSRGEDLFEFRKEVEMVKEKKFVCSLELHCFLTCLWDAVEQKGVVKSPRSNIILWGPLLLLLPSAKLDTFLSLPHLGR